MSSMSSIGCLLSARDIGLLVVRRAGRRKRVGRPKGEREGRVGWDYRRAAAELSLRFRGPLAWGREWITRWIYGAGNAGQKWRE